MAARSAPPLRSLLVVVVFHCSKPVIYPFGGRVESMLRSVPDFVCDNLTIDDVRSLLQPLMSFVLLPTLGRRKYLHKNVKHTVCSFNFMVVGLWCGRLSPIYKPPDDFTRSNLLKISRLPGVILQKKTIAIHSYSCDLPYHLYALSPHTADRFI